MVGTAAKRMQQRQILALLAAVGALVLPVSGALQYLDLFNSDAGPPPWVVPFIGASNASDVLGPVLAVGALALGVIALGRAPLASGPSRAVIATVIVVAALSQAAAFAVSAFDLVASDNYSIPAEAAWQAAKWATFARLAVQGLVCVGVIAYGMRWLDPDDRRAAP